MSNNNGIPILDGFELKTNKSYLDKRNEIASATALKDLNEKYYPDGFILYAKLEDKYYKFDSRVDYNPYTGRWREASLTPAHVDEAKQTLYL